MVIPEKKTPSSLFYFPVSCLRASRFFFSLFIFVSRFLVKIVYVKCVTCVLIEPLVETDFIEDFTLGRCVDLARFCSTLRRIIGSNKGRSL